MGGPSKQSTNDSAAPEQGLAESPELDQYDLLSSTAPEPRAREQGSRLSTDLSATTNAFNTRIQRKKKEQEKALTEAEKGTRVRQLLMLKTLVSIRKSLRDVTRIDLGERFHFTLVADDIAGWARLTVKLCDALLPDAEYPFLRVSAHDRQSRGCVEIEYDPSAAVESISVISESELKRLPTALKKCVRVFLDLMGDIVLEAERKAEEMSMDDGLASRSVMPEPQETRSDISLTEDLFEEQGFGEDILETLPSLQNIDALPSFGDSSARRGTKGDG